MGREYPEEKAPRRPEFNRRELDPEKRALLTEQLRRAELKQNVMDYSLLMGIHNLYF